jgi:N-acetylneuraminic acid mutarotase
MSMTEKYDICKCAAIYDDIPTYAVRMHIELNGLTASGVGYDARIDEWNMDSRKVEQISEQYSKIKESFGVLVKSGCLEQREFDRTFREVEHIVSDMEKQPKNKAISSEDKCTLTKWAYDLAGSAPAEILFKIARLCEK